MDTTTHPAYKRAINRLMEDEAYDVIEMMIIEALRFDLSNKEMAL